MTSPLERLSGPGKPLVAEPPDAKEFANLKAKAAARLKDAENEGISLEGRFDLAYGAAYSMSLAALRWHGYRAQNRYIVFQALKHTLGVEAETVRLLSKCHDTRNHGEYEGELNVTERLVADLIDAARALATEVGKLSPPD